jgi:biopolymer transport protein ExbD
MAEPKKLLDVWIVELNTVYRQVPFAVVIDWLQEGRLLPADKVSIAGANSWRHVSDVKAFAPFLPHAEPHRAEDRAEALEPVEMDLSWRNPAETEDEDVDMIPLIDISLVLLIFFMMTAVVSTGVFSPIKTPAARHQLLVITKDMYWVGIDTRGPNGKIDKTDDGKPLPWYSLGKEDAQIQPPTQNVKEILQVLERELEPDEGEVRIRIRGHEDLPIETVRDLTAELQGLENKMNAARQKQKLGRLSLSFAAEVSEIKGK